MVDRASRLVVTNHHVVGANNPARVSVVVPEDRLRVYFPRRREGKLVTNRDDYLQNAPYFKARIIDSSPEQDLAVLQLDSLPADVVPLPLTAQSPEPGSRVHSIGNAGASGALFVYTSGTVRQLYRGEFNYGDGQIVKTNVMETQSPTNPGTAAGRW